MSRSKFAWCPIVSVLGVVALLGVSCSKNADVQQAGSGSGETVNQAGQVTISVPAQATEQPKPGGKIVYGIEAETDGWNPTMNKWAISGTLIANAIFDPLVALDANQQPKPYLAESIEHSPDYLTWTIKVRPGIKFHNGQSLDAAAGKKFTDALKNSPLTGPAARNVDSTEIVDDLTTKVHMKQPWVAFPFLLTAQGGVVPAPEQLDRAAAGDPRGNNEPIGTGPFVFKEWVRDQKLVVTKNPNYWQKNKAGQPLPYLDEIEFKPVPDGQNRFNALQAGNINVLHDDSQTRAPNYKELATSGKFQYFEGGGEDEESFVMLNVREEPLSDKRLRQALAYGTDLNLVEAVTGEPPSLQADSPWNKDGPWYSDPGYPKFDQAKAKSMVDAWKAEHGGTAPAFVLESTPDLVTVQLAQALQQQFQAIGFNVELRTSEQIKYILDGVTGNYQAKLWRQYSAPDPDGEYHWWVSENATAKGTLGLNFARIQNPELDAALNEGRSNPDPTARKAAYAKVAKIFADEVPFVWLHHVRWSIVTDSKVRDILNGPLPDGTPSLPILAGVHRLTYAWVAA